MSTDIKYQVMAELLDIHPAALEKAEEQASKIIEMVKGEGRFAPVIRWPNEAGVDGHESLKVRSPESRPKHSPEPTKESKALTAKIVSLRDGGMAWHKIAAQAGLTKEATRKRYREWDRKQKEFCGIPKDEPKVWEKQAVTTNTAVLSENAQLTPPLVSDLYEPGAEEARQEAKAAEATIRKSLTVEPANPDNNPDKMSGSVDIDAFIQERIAAGDMDYEVWQAVKRNFPGISISVADIRSRRQVA